jgi:tetratricopeptide (TPR) repeat protein
MLGSKSKICALLVFLWLIMAWLPSALTAQEGKIPITTSSKEALSAFLTGRDLQDKLRFQESEKYLEDAIAKDSEFAMAHLFLAFARPTLSAYFESFNRALALKDKVSECERLWILGTEAGNAGDAKTQEEHYLKLVELCPNDERGHTLLGNFYFTFQNYKKAIDAYNKAIAINPDFSQPYNQLGYAHRFLGDYPQAEVAFKKYIKLIPDDPNPYDSYAELLMKMGRYDESIDYYKKALTVNSKFLNSYLGIATNLNFKGQHAKARAELKEFLGRAANDGQKRACYAAMAVSYCDEKNCEMAIKMLDKSYAIAEASNDLLNMAGDLSLMATILLNSGKPDEAMQKLEKTMKYIENSGLDQDVIENSRQIYLYGSTMAALAKNDLTKAKAEAEKHKAKAEALGNAFQIRQSHELAAAIALVEKDYQKALAELEQSNLQNPYNLYRKGLAYEGLGDKEMARQMYSAAAHANSLNNINLALIRKKAEARLSDL